MLMPLIPVALVLEFAHASASVIFITAALGIIPTAALMGRATEELAARSGPGIGGFLNVTFGNFPELVIAFFALLEGLQEVVKASIIGSILGNILLVMGAAMFVGGPGSRPPDLRPYRGGRTVGDAAAGDGRARHAGGVPARRRRRPAGVEDERVDFGSDVERLSFAVALVLIGSYVAGLIFSLKTHSSLFNPSHEAEEEYTAASRGASAKASSRWRSPASWSAIMSEVLVGSISEAAGTHRPV